MKRLLLPLFTALALSAIALFRMDGFSLSKIRGNLCEGSAPSIEIRYREVLSQPFHYLAKGRQCFVFESEDGKTVIKFLNYHRFSLPWYLPRILFWKEKLNAWEERRHRRFDETVNSFHLADQMLKDETGLLYVHLQKGGNLPHLQMIDHAHRKHSIDLNETAFVLQRKAVPIFEELSRRFQTGGAIALEEGISAFTAFLQKRCSLLVADDDRDVEINFGFCDGKIMLLDPGRLYFNPALKDVEKANEEMAVASKRLRRWLTKRYPESISVLDIQLQDKLCPKI